MGVLNYTLNYTLNYDTIYGCPELHRPELHRVKPLGQARNDEEIPVCSGG